MSNWTPRTLTPAESAVLLQQFHTASGIPATLLAELLREATGGHPNWDNFYRTWVDYKFTRGNVDLPFQCPEDASNLVKMYLAVARIMFKEELGLNKGFQSRARAVDSELVARDCPLKWQSLIKGKERVTWLPFRGKEGEEPKKEPKKAPIKRTSKTSQAAEVSEDDEETEHVWNKPIGPEISKLRAFLEVPAEKLCELFPKTLEVKLAGLCTYLVKLKAHNDEFRKIEQNGWDGLAEWNSGTAGYAKGDAAEEGEEADEEGDEEGGERRGQDDEVEEEDEAE
ncbi:hypothetical protein BU16DRAFT_568284 [Lophium mytilinum]|uniref:Uncharacterized protein n=1 Tax=Lophium mytilinum TaxID=390894 RepID=A0A6A6Q8S2_9PEZI|nr:hypothetical protein BU16DRAFT_568284 [Lophium mytilinum]